MIKFCEMWLKPINNYYYFDWSMGSVMFRNRYWYYKSLYDDYVGREFRMAFGLSFVLWLPHYWYPAYDVGMVSTWTDLLKRMPPTRTISSSGTPEGTDSPTTSSSRNSKWISRDGCNSKKNGKKVHNLIFRWRITEINQIASPWEPMIIWKWINEHNNTIIHHGLLNRFKK